MVQISFRGAAFGAAMLLASGGMASAQNLLTNGDFENNNSSFNSQYNYQTPPQGPYNSNGIYNTATSGGAAGIYSSWKDSNVLPHTGSYALYADGSSESSRYVWATTVSGLSTNTNYTLTFWGNSLTTLNLPVLALDVNSVMGVTQLATAYNTWQSVSFTFNTGNATGASFAIRDLNTQANGNDFALDSIALTATAVPGPVAGAGIPALFAMLGYGLWRNRRARLAA